MIHVIDANGHSRYVASPGDDEKIATISTFDGRAAIHAFYNHVLVHTCYGGVVAVYAAGMLP